jgi:hypothetical protein
MKNIKLLFFGLLALAFTSCETVVDLDLKQSESKLVVEGTITDATDFNFVKLSLSGPYGKGAELVAVNDAQVTVTDNLGNAVAFLPGPNGTYKPAPGFIGVIGRTYNLTVNAGGKTYTATSVLNPVAELDTVKYEYTGKDGDKFGREEGYYLSAAVQDVAGQKNYYKFNLFRNGEWTEKNFDNIMVSDDRFFDGSYLDQIDFNEKFAKGDSIKVDLLSLTKEAYEFYQAVLQLAGQGGLFGRTPANLPSNISNGAVGFFSASAVSSKTIIIK